MGRTGSRSRSQVYSAQSGITGIGTNLGQRVRHGVGHPLGVLPQQPQKSQDVDLLNGTRPPVKTIAEFGVGQDTAVVINNERRGFRVRRSESRGTDTKETRELIYM